MTLAEAAAKSYILDEGPTRSLEPEDRLAVFRSIWTQLFQDLSPELRAVVETLEVEHEI